MDMKLPFSQSRLLVFIAISLLVHLAWFIGSQTYHVAVPDQQGQQGQQMAVRLSEETPLAQNQPQTKPKTTKTVQAVKPEERIQQKQSALQKKQPLNQLAYAQVLSHIKQQIANNFSYPYLARRQGWQGKVLLVFTVNNSGDIQDIRVKQSSGYALLDNSAIEALNKLGKITLQQEWQLSSNKQFELPVIYRLQKG